MSAVRARHVGELNPNGDLTASMHVEKQVNKTVAPDGLYWAKGSDGPGVLILDEDSAMTMESENLRFQ